MGTESRAYRDKSDPLVAALAAEQWGVVTVRELAERGLDRDAIARRVRSGRLHRVFRGVYAVGHSGLAPEGTWLAAVMACGAQALLSHACSVMLFGLWPVEDRLPEVTVAHAARRAPAGIRVHRARNLHPEDIARCRGVPTTSVARTIMDLAPRLGDIPLRRLMSRAQSMHLTNLRLLARQVDRAHGRPGRARFARVLAGAPPATRSELEDRLHDLLSAAGLTAPHVNVPLHLDGRRIIPDLRWPEQRLVVEADGRQWHGTPQARAEDAERQAILESHGERVIRVTWEQATAGAAQTLTRVSVALGGRRAEERDHRSSSEPMGTTGPP